MSLFPPPIALISGRRPVALEGRLHPTFSPVASVLRRQLQRSKGGAAVCIYHRGECVVDLWGGARDSAGTPWTRDTMSPSFSTTKGVASTILHRLVDRGLLDYDDRVATHWPEFGQAGKDGITVRQVLSHQSGLYHIRHMVDHADRMLDWDYMIHAIERSAPIHVPGERTGYHGLTYGFIVGEIVQRLTGKPFSRLVQDEIAEPLGLDGMYIGAPDETLDRAAGLIWPERGSILRMIPIGPSIQQLSDVAETISPWLRAAMRTVGIHIDLGSILDALAPRGISGFDFGSNETLRAAIPAVNGLFTARSLAKMYAALAGGGEIDGVRLLSGETIRRATEVQTEAPSRAVLPFDMRWRLGYHGVFTTRGSPRQAFGHFGIGGSGGWADPSRELAVAMIVNWGMGTPLGDLRIARIGAAALLSADRRAAASALRRQRPGVNEVEAHGSRLRFPLPLPVWPKLIGQG